MEGNNMKIVTSRTDLAILMSENKKMGKSIGFVPTMGYLHEGHLTLAKAAREQNDLVVMSIFVNPLQFGPGEDFETYPRDTVRDTAFAESAGVDYLFIPAVEEMYPNPLSLDIKVTDRVDVLCGKKRQGHFDGVAAVLIKLFNLVMPERAYFGLKDAQQVAVIHGLIDDLFFPIEIVGIPTVREEDGLAKSSRNVRLNEKERHEAPELYQALLKARKAVLDGEKSTAKIVDIVKKHISESTSGKIDYVEIYAYPSLSIIESFDVKGKVIMAIAVQFDKARLIDNIILNMDF
jgi:pantoate--beta-alanine ligase